MPQKVQIPYIENSDTLSPKDLMPLLEREGVRLMIDKNNWPKEYPYTPLVVVTIGYNDNAILLHYHVLSEGLRTMSPSDGHYVYEDSCVEFFMQPERGASYINIEWNACGICYASHHNDPKKLIPFSPEEYQTIKRYSTMDSAKVDVDGLHAWSIVTIVPWKTMGFESIPHQFYGNFYKCGDKTTIPHFLSWSEIPNRPTPAFHCPENFGVLELLSNKK